MLKSATTAATTFFSKCCKNRKLLKTFFSLKSHGKNRLKIQFRYLISDYQYSLEIGKVLLLPLYLVNLCVYML